MSTEEAVAQTEEPTPPDAEFLQGYMAAGRYFDRLTARPVSALLRRASERQLMQHARIAGIDPITEPFIAGWRAVEGNRIADAGYMARRSKTDRLWLEARRALVDAYHAGMEDAETYLLRAWARVQWTDRIRHAQFKDIERAARRRRFHPQETTRTAFETGWRHWYNFRIEAADAGIETADILLHPEEFLPKGGPFAKGSRRTEYSNP